MFEIIDGKVVFSTKMEQVVSSEDFYNNINSLEATIQDFSKQIELLKHDLEIVLKLESKINNNK